MLTSNFNNSKTLREEYGRTVIVPRFYKHPFKKKKFTMKELSKHNTKDDAWVCIERKIYNLSKYLEYHPGGTLPILNLAGKDATDVFTNFHPAIAYEKLPSYYMGDLTPQPTVSNFVQEHRQLRQTLLQNGLFETSQTFYIGYGLWLATLFFSALYCTIFCNTFNDHMTGAMLLGLFWQQLAFLGHDIGHNAISHNRQLDLKYGIAIGNTLGGISLGWWKYSHNAHHIVCNSIENDPDNQHLPVFAPDKEYFGRFFSSFHQKYFSFDLLSKTLVSYQHLVFYPIMMFARFNLYIQSILFLISKEKINHKTLEMTTLCVFYFWYSCILTCCMGSWQERVFYIALSHAIAGVLHVQVILSHFADEVYHGKPYNDENDEWFRLQLKTTLNIKCPAYLDWIHGGLQFQIEHHLFPRVPRHNLRTVQKLVKTFCKKHHIEYNELNFYKANVRLIQKLYNTAINAQKSTRNDCGFYESQIYGGLNLIG
jgi:fatty acid desaturase/predicted heme/steroid binding protein